MGCEKAASTAAQPHQDSAPPCNFNRRCGETQTRTNLALRPSMGWLCSLHRAHPAHEGPRRPPTTTQVAGGCSGGSAIYHPGRRQQGPSALLSTPTTQGAATPSGLRQDHTAADKARQDQIGQDRTGQDETGRDRTRHDKTRQDETRQDQITQDRTSRDIPRRNKRNQIR